MPGRTTTSGTFDRPQRGSDPDRHLERHVVALDQSRTVSGPDENRQEESRVAVIGLGPLDRATHSVSADCVQSTLTFAVVFCVATLPRPASPGPALGLLEGRASAALPHFPVL